MNSASESDTDEDARDLAACRPSSVVKAAAGAMAFSGVGSLMLALQALLLVAGSQNELLTVALSLEVLLGVLLLVLAIRLLKVQFLTTLAAAVLGFASAVALLVWNVVALSRGLFSILGFAVPGLCMIASLLALSALGSTRRASTARKRLRERGVSLGL
jgi:hypothetical protein